MTSLGRVYVATATLLVFFVLWAVIAASPWATRASDPQAQAVDRREAVVRLALRSAECAHAARWDRYRAELAASRAQKVATPTPASVPQVRVVTLPPITTTRSS